MRPAEWALPSKKSVRTQSMRNAGMLLEQCLCDDSLGARGMLACGNLLARVANCWGSARGMLSKCLRIAGVMLAECLRNACVMPA